jgi:hypothetical protein
MIQNAAYTKKDAEFRIFFRIYDQQVAYLALFFGFFYRNLHNGGFCMTNKASGIIFSPFPR